MSTDTGHHVHALIDQLPPIQLAALETILQSMLDPVSRKLALAPPDDEPFTEGDRRPVAEADEWSKHNMPIALETVLADLGLTGGGLGDHGEDSARGGKQAKWLSGLRSLIRPEPISALSRSQTRCGFFNFPRSRRLR